MFIEGIPFIQTGDHCVQLGSRPERSYTLSHLSSNEVAFIKQLPKLGSEQERRECATLLRIDTKRYEYVRALLESTNVTCDRQARTSDELWWARLDGDITYCERQRGRRIRLPYLPALGYVLAHMLAKSAYEMIIIPDKTPVSTWDTTFFGSQYVHKKRFDVANDTIHPEYGRIVHSASWWDMDISITSYYPDTYTAEKAGSDGRVFLPVVMDEGGVSVGPMACGATVGCCECLLHHRHDDDPYSSYRDMQLLDAPHTGLETLLTYRVAAFIARNIADYFGGRLPATVNNVYYFEAHKTAPTITKCPPHPNCSRHGRDHNRGRDQQHSADPNRHDYPQDPNRDYPQERSQNHGQDDPHQRDYPQAA